MREWRKTSQNLQTFQKKTFLSFCLIIFRKGNVLFILCFQNYDSFGHSIGNNLPDHSQIKFRASSLPKLTQLESRNVPIKYSELVSLSSSEFITRHGMGHNITDCLLNFRNVLRPNGFTENARKEKLSFFNSHFQKS